MCDCPEADSDGEAVPRNLDAAEVARGRRLRRVVELAQTRGTVRVASRTIKCNMSIGTDAAEPETDATERSDLALEFCAVLVDAGENALALGLHLVRRVSPPKAQIDAVVAEHHSSIAAILAPDLPQVHLSQRVAGRDTHTGCGRKMTLRHGPPWQAQGARRRTRGLLQMLTMQKETDRIPRTSIAFFSSIPKFCR